MIETGGSFTARKTRVGPVTLAAGIWLVDADFTNDLFNVGSGALENPTPTILTDGDTINSYFSGSSEITVPAGGETLDVYAFGYDSDTGEGSYVLLARGPGANQALPSTGGGTRRGRSRSLTAGPAGWAS